MKAQARAWPPTPVKSNIIVLVKTIHVHRVIEVGIHTLNPLNLGFSFVKRLLVFAKVQGGGN